MVKSVINGVSTYYVGRHYEKVVDGETTIVRKYYIAGSTTIAMRTIEGETNTLNWLLGDHLGSTSVTTTDDGTYFSELRYTAFGEVRYSHNTMPTDYLYTGQRRTVILQSTLNTSVINMRSARILKNKYLLLKINDRCVKKPPGMAV